MHFIIKFRSGLLTCWLALILGQVAIASAEPISTTEDTAGRALAEACTAAADPSLLPVLGKQFDGFRQAFPKSSGLGELTSLYLGTLDRLDPAAAAAAEVRYSTDENPVVARLARIARNAREARQQRENELRASDWAAIKFTAVDGREVDIAKLRGKVVLIDFWATWCGWCVAELPNVVTNYRKYHAQGFEVLGLTFEDARLRPDDTPAIRATKLDRARKFLLSFTARFGLVWPQYFDGQGMANDLARPFRVESIPLMVLLDRQGQVAALNVRGPDLEVALKKCLAQEPSLAGTTAR